MKSLFILTFFLTTQFFYSQNSLIKGVVLDEATGKSLPGVNIVIKGAKLATVSDLDGNFIFRKVLVGTYELQFSTTSYQTKLISDVTTTANETTTLTVSMSESNNVLNEIVIKSTSMKTESVKSLLTMQKNSISVSDGISAETIKRTPDKNTSDVLKRISGASIQDNKFVIIRGLNDRYNTAFLNGAPLPSSEPDRKAFSFDIFPSNMIDNLIITKTATPDLPGEFAGGVIQINTKGIPDKNFQTLSVGSGYNTVTTGKNQVYYKGGKTDWLGIDDGTRALPASIPGVNGVNGLSGEQKVALAKDIATDWGLYDKKFTPNLSLQYALGYHFDIKDKDLGILASLTYSNTNNYNETSRNDYEGIGIGSFIDQDLVDKTYSQATLLGALANFSLKLNGNNSINFKNIYSINSDDRLIDRRGAPRDALQDNPANINATARWFTSNKIFSSQLMGDHFLPHSKIKINWVGSLSTIKRSIPNLRRNVYTGFNNYFDPENPNPDDLVYKATIPSTEMGGGPDYGGGMFFAENTEKVYFGKADFSKKLNFKNDFNTEIKFGVAYQNRDREFFARQLSYIKVSNFNGVSVPFDESLLVLDNNQIFNPSNMGVLPSGKGGFTLGDATQYYDNYTAGSKLHSAYLMFDHGYKKLRLVWGVRVEDYIQELVSVIPSISRDKQQKLVDKQIDFLPSVNLIYAVTKKQNLRFSYSKTLNRPEFREIAPFLFYDFNTQFNVGGNPDLKIANIENFDFRYEIYPGKGQLFSFSVFSKKFKNPIEMKAGVNNKEVLYENAEAATNSGIEIEFRALLSSLFGAENSNFLNNLTAFSNFALINSKVDVSNIAAVTDLEKSRPLQGQSPYVLNAGLQYIQKDKDWSVSTNLNRIGNRIYIAGNSESEATIWEKSRTFLDAQLTKSLLKNKMEIKLNIQNILAQDLIFYENNDLELNSGANLKGIDALIEPFKNPNAAFDKNVDNLRWLTKFGRTFSLSITYNF